MTEQEYETAISIARERVLENIELLEEGFERMKDELAEKKNVKMARTLLNASLLIAHTDEGRRIFLKILKFAGEISAELAEKYWLEFDDIENLVKKHFFNVELGPSDGSNRVNIS